VSIVRTHIKNVLARHMQIHGPLLAKGLSFSALFATIPLLFLLSVAGSVALTPEVQQLLEEQLLWVLPAAAQRSIENSMERLAASPGSLSILTVGVFLWSVHQLFFDIHRVVRAAFGMRVSPARGRARAVGLSGVFLVMLYGAALIGIASRFLAPYVAAPAWIVQTIAWASATLIIAAVLLSLIRLASGLPLRLRLSAPPALVGALVWQIGSALAGLVIVGAGRRFIVYGVLASAVLFLILMRLYAEVLLHTALWIHEFDPQEPAS
jgi:membrane protein